MTQRDIEYLKNTLLRINELMISIEEDCSSSLKKIPRKNYKRALNLLHYLVLRSLDIRRLQDKLHEAGLSSLASSEGHARYQILSVLDRLHVPVDFPENLEDYKSARRSLKKKAAQLFGVHKANRMPSIMVTLDGEMATDYEYVEKMISSGMTIARINCAHDDRKIWLKMIQNIRKASESLGLDCKIYMDLAGPKLRTLFVGKERIKVNPDELIYLTDEAHLKKSSRKIVGCTIPGVAKELKVGELVLFDDGMIESRVEKIGKHIVHLRVTRISSKKSQIKKEKGMNFPLSKLSLPALTKYDKKCIPFILTHADMVGYSFVRDVEDLKALRKFMKGSKKDLIIKIETLEAVNNLPSLLFYSMRHGNFGIMIARGDLAVEIGFERMSEIQEEILWICEAAHIPVIWATQVLQSLNKSGVATRSEITDAAHAAQADCVMINKGKHVEKVLATLKDITVRTGGHHVKKRFTFRPLTIAKNFIDGLDLEYDVEPAKKTKSKEQPVAVP